MSVRGPNALSTAYDQSLLATTPEVSRAAKQEGYNIDLLDDPRPVRGSTTPRSDPELAYSKENYNVLSSVGGVRAPARVPFWRTRNGIIAIAILAIILVGAVVGGAVGGTVGHNEKKTTNGSPDEGSAGSAPEMAGSKPNGTSSNGGVAPISTPSQAQVQVPGGQQQARPTTPSPSPSPFPVNF